MPARRRPIDVHGQAAEVIERESLEKIPWKLQRLQGIRLAMEGQDGCRRIAQFVRTTAATLIKWITDPDWTTRTHSGMPRQRILGTSATTPTA